MDLAALIDRLEELPQQSIVYFESNKMKRKLYPEVRRDALVVLDWMNACGVQSGMRIGVLAENCYAWVLHELATVRLGAILVSFPPDEFASASFAELGHRYGLDLLICSRRELARRAARPAWVALIDDWTDPITLRQEGGTARLHPDIYSFVFSSGTSGKLKCILMSKRGTEELVDAYGKNYAFESSDSILVVLPLSNFQQRLMVYTAMWYGFDLQVADSAMFFRALKEMRPKILAGPPAFYEGVENRFRNLLPRQRALLLAASRAIRSLTFGSMRQALLRKVFARFHAAYGGRIRLMLTGAAAAGISTLELFEAMGFPLYQAYGLTETGFVSWNLPGRNRRGSVGRLVFEGGASLTDDGEILVHYRYPQSAGYLDSPDEESKTFLGERGIATGDIGRFDEDGYLYIVGRKKQIIVTQGGYKLQPEPLEMEIERCPEASRAVVFGGEELAVITAVIGVRTETGAHAERSIRSAVDELNARLPAQARIARLVFTKKPFTRENGFLTRNLKIDRNAVYREFRQQLSGISSGHDERKQATV